ncbi:MAG: CIA30 family protein [Pseudomonadota bacterium]
MTPHPIPLHPADWMFVSDGVMGGVSEGAMAFEEHAGEVALRLTGTVRTERNGGFIQMRTTLTDPLPETAEALKIRVRGNGERYFVHLRTPASRRPWHSYRAGFETGPDWREVTLPFTAFQPSDPTLPAPIAPAHVRSVGLVAIGRAHQADLWLAAISAA